MWQLLYPPDKHDLYTSSASLFCDTSEYTGDYDRTWECNHRKSGYMEAEMCKEKMSRLRHIISLFENSVTYSQGMSTRLLNTPEWNFGSVLGLQVEGRKSHGPEGESWGTVCT